MTLRFDEALLTEAVCSSLIEGEEVSAPAVRAFAERGEVGERPPEDLRRCLNLYRAMRDLRGRPGARLVRDVHRRLFDGAEPADVNVTPGEYRTVPAWIHKGYIPVPDPETGEWKIMPDLLPMTPPEKIAKLMREWSAEVRRQEAPSPYQAGVDHQIFERIHPFSDGNGRVGRAIIRAQLGYGLSDLIWEDRSAYYHSLDGGPEACGKFLAKLAKRRKR